MDPPPHDEPPSEAQGPPSPAVDAAPQIIAPAPAPTPAASTRRTRTQWSGVPLAASLALVAFAILFGIYGPRVVDRATPPLGVPVWDLAEAAAGRHLDRMFDAFYGEAETPVSADEAGVKLREIVGFDVRLPDLAPLGFVTLAPRPVTVPGSMRGALLLYARQRGEQREVLSLTLVPDQAQYVVFSPFGHPLFLPSWESYVVELPETGFGESTALVWSDGKVIRVAVALNPRTLAALEEPLLRSTPAPLAGPSTAPLGEPP